MNILIATDGSKDANNALDFILRFPFPGDSKMTVLAVVDEIPMLPAELDVLDQAQYDALAQANKLLNDEAEEILAHESGRLRDDGWSGETMLRNGNPADVILDVADEIDADLIVLGSHGRSMTRRFLLGSVSDRVLEYAKCSVLIVKSKAMDKLPETIEPGKNAPFKITLAYDNSDVAHAALDLCASFPLEDRSVINVVYVMPLITAYRQDIRQHINSIWLKKKQIMQAELDKAVRSLQWAASDVSTQLREASNVSDEILTAAEEADSDLIMFGCKDRGSLSNFLHGSITRRLARYAKSTVWAVRKKQDL